ncbi:hypothetical protein GCM10011350_18250 [Marinomonas arctica]|nr:hypothetical protein GCM10011350_18250 [Marinomonas arctica]
MAKGKVRCGQCFHIFNASDSINDKTKAEPSTPSDKAATSPVKPTLPLAQTSTINASIEKRLPPTEEIVNPDWLDTLFNDKDLTPFDEKDTQTFLDTRQNESTIPNRAADKQPDLPRETLNAKRSMTATLSEEPAPWEVELAEVEAALKAAPAVKTNAQNSTPPNTNALANNELSDALNAVKTTNATWQTTAKPFSNQPQPTTQKEPDYMAALHSLAQSAAEQTRPSDIKNQHSILEQLSAQQSLAPLLGENESLSRRKSGHPWLWFFASVFGIALLTLQVAMHFFEEGSRSSNFRSLYRTICSYSGCVLPRFEDVSTITIQHVRIQSHPTLPNTLLVNAIITNASHFSQPMPKIALEFFDLNGQPVAARLFSPTDYLQKDFLDITYMPPNTPIHLVIPIQDPGARAVTHQLKAFPADTRSY